MLCLFKAMATVMNLQKMLTWWLCREVFYLNRGVNWSSLVSCMSVTGLPCGSDGAVRDWRGQTGAGRYSRGRGGFIDQSWDPSVWAGWVVFSVTCHLWRSSEKCNLTLNAEESSLSVTSLRHLNEERIL